MRRGWRSRRDVAVRSLCGRCAVATSLCGCRVAVASRSLCDVAVREKGRTGITGATRTTATVVSIAAFVTIQHTGRFATNGKPVNTLRIVPNDMTVTTTIIGNIGLCDIAGMTGRRRTNDQGDIIGRTDITGTTRSTDTIGKVVRDVQFGINRSIGNSLAFPTIPTTGIGPIHVVTVTTFNIVVCLLTVSIGKVETFVKIVKSQRYVTDDRTGIIPRTDTDVMTGMIAITDPTGATKPFQLTDNIGKDGTRVTFLTTVTILPTVNTRNIATTRTIVTSQPFGSTLTIVTRRNNGISDASGILEQFDIIGMIDTIVRFERHPITRSNAAIGRTDTMRNNRPIRPNLQISHNRYPYGLAVVCRVAVVASLNYSTIRYGWRLSRIIFGIRQNGQSAESSQSA